MTKISLRLEAAAAAAVFLSAAEQHHSARPSCLSVTVIRQSIQRNICLAEALDSLLPSRSDRAERDGPVVGHEAEADDGQAWMAEPVGDGHYGHEPHCQ